MRGKGTSVCPVYGRGRSFTLIELLIVIAIITIFTAIPFPIFKNAKETG